jgi:putative membrane protein
MSGLFRILRAILRFFVVWFVDTVSLLATAWLLPGITIQAQQDRPAIVVAVAASLLLGMVNLLIRPLILMLALPLGWMGIFLTGFFTNAIVLMITSRLIPAFEVSGWISAFFGGLLLALANTLLITLLNVDDDESFYHSLVIRSASRQGESRSGRREQKAGKEGERGLVMLEIDGLSY